MCLSILLMHIFILKWVLHYVQVCLHAAASVAKENVGHVLYLDTGNAFSPRRIQHIIGLMSGSPEQVIISFHTHCYEVFIYSIYLGLTCILFYHYFNLFLQAKHKILQNLMAKIFCYPVFDIFAMFDLLHQLELDLRSQVSSKMKHFGICIFM